MVIDPKKPVVLIETKKFYNGPLTGLCEHNGEKYWFKSYIDYTYRFKDEVSGKTKKEVVRTYCAVKLSKFMIKYLIFGKKVFRKLVGLSYYKTMLWYRFLYPLFDLDLSGKPAFAFYWTKVDKETGKLTGVILTPAGVSLKTD